MTRPFAPLRPTARRLALAAACGLGLIAGPPAASHAQTAPATAPPATAPGRMPDMGQMPAAPMVEPDAAVKPLLEQMAAAYRDVEALELEGTVAGDFDAAGQQQKQSQPFTAAFKAPNQFRHDATDQLVVVATGADLFLFDPKANVFLKHPAPAGPLTLSAMPMPFPAALQRTQNVSLLLALSGDPMTVLREGADTIAAGEPIDIDGQSHPVVNIASEGSQVRMVLDPTTHLVRRMMVNLAGTLTAQGIPAVNKAEVTIDYSRSDVGGNLPADRFAFTPPAGATDAAAGPPPTTRPGIAPTVAPPTDAPPTDDGAAPMPEMPQ